MYEKTLDSLSYV